MNRDKYFNTQAHHIIEPGAVNITAITNTLAELTLGLRESGMGEHEIRTHHAVVVICVQIDELVKASNFDVFEKAYNKLKEELKNK